MFASSNVLISFYSRERFRGVQLISIGGAHFRGLVMMLQAMIDLAVVGGAEACCVPSWPVVTVDVRFWC